ncbi:MAG: NAD(+)/NADH kinase [Clostridia bacterium]|nr:NAD(+)/NADH kinase [Clostridia bacterium]
MKKTVILPNSSKDPGYGCTALVVRELFGYGAEIYMPEECRESGITEGVTYLREGLCDGADVIIVLGGDGSILDAARIAYPHGIPVLGINLGRVGYMATIEKDELSLLGHLFDGDYTIDERMMLEARIIREGETVLVTPPALNEIVLTRGALSRMLDIELQCNGMFVGEYRADGLIFATPTGSTAYSMSAGGPVLDPCLEAVSVTPICPHYLSTRPIVFSDSAQFTASAKNTEEWYMTVDGKENFTLRSDDMVMIAMSAYATRLVDIKKNAFYNVLRKKTAEKQ